MKTQAPGKFEGRPGADSLPPPAGNADRHRQYTPETGYTPNAARMRAGNSPQHKPGTTYPPGQIPATQKQHKSNTKTQIVGVVLWEMELVQAICVAYAITEAELSGRRKTDEIANARCAQTAFMFHSRGLSKRRIAREVGIHEQSPAIQNRLDRHEALMFTSRDYKDRYGALCRLMEEDHTKNGNSDNRNFGHGSGLC